MRGHDELQNILQLNRPACAVPTLEQERSDVLFESSFFIAVVIDFPTGFL